MRTWFHVQLDQKILDGLYSTTTYCVVSSQQQVAWGSLLKYTIPFSDVPNKQKGNNKRARQIIYDFSYEYFEIVVSCSLHYLNKYFSMVLILKEIKISL